MSYFDKLFNRKRQSRDLEKMEQEAYLETEEEDAFLKETSFQEDEDTAEPEEETDKTISENQEDQEEYEIVEREILPAKIICPDCGGITLEGLEFCDKCGGELQ